MIIFFPDALISITLAICADGQRTENEANKASEEEEKFNSNLEGKLSSWRHNVKFNNANTGL